MNQKKLIIIRTVLIFLTIVVAGIIFMLSADNAEASDAKSEKFSNPLIENALAVFNLNEDKAEILINICIKIVRKAAHFTEYSVLGFLIAAICVSFYLKTNLTVFISFILGALYAVSDEIHQYFVPGRSCQFSDMLLDSAGVIFGTALLLILIRTYKTIKNKKTLRVD